MRGKKLPLFYFVVLFSSILLLTLFSVELDHFFLAVASKFPTAFFPYQTLAFVLPAFSAVSSLLFIAFIAYKRKNKTWHNFYLPYLHCALAFLLGPLLAVESLKHTWGRLRPIQAQADLKSLYSPFWQVVSFGGNSFPSMHVAISCTIGVVLFSFGYRRTGLLLGGVLVLATSAVRIAQQQHYFSDTFMAAVIVILTSWLSYLLLRWGGEFLVRKKRVELLRR